MCMALERGRTDYSEEEIVAPRMPDMTPVEDYYERLVGNTTKLLSETLPLLPNVTHELLHLCGAAAGSVQHKTTEEGH